MDKAIVVVASDTHTNSYDGLCPPYFEHSGGTHQAYDEQRFLWRHWLKFVERIQERAAQVQAPVVTILNGDICDRHEKTTALIVRNDVEMLRLAFEAHKPLIDISDKLFVVDGTYAHTFGFEEKIAEDIGAVKKRRRWARPVVHLKIADRLIWAAHHGKMGRLGWTEKNAANKLVSETWHTCMANDMKKPDLVIRSHQHRWSDSYDNFQGTRGLFCACWQYPTEYIYRINPDGIPQIGGLIITIERGKNIEVEKFRVPIKPERPEVVEL